MDVKVDDIIYGENATVRVLVPTDASGNVTINIDGKIIKTVNVTNGTAILENISGLAGGKHIVNVTYNGCNLYSPNDYNGTDFNVKSTSDWKMSIDIAEHPYGENTTIFVDTNPYHLAVNNVTIIIDNIHYTVNLTAGKGNLTLNNLSAGNHNATAHYVGDANYTEKSQKFRVQIDKAEPSVNLTQSGNDVVATVSGNATGTVVFYINGVRYENTTVNGNATIKGKLGYGNNSVIATYEGNQNYTKNYAISTFEINKNACQINVTSVSIEVGKTAVINITGPGDWNGNATVIVNKIPYSVKITNGRGQLNVTGLGNGTYDVKVTFAENNKYWEGTNNTAQVIVSKVNLTSIGVSVGNITEGEVAVVNVTLPVDATGNVTVKIGNITRTVPIAGGLNEIIVPGVPEGEHNVNITYNGDNKYNPVNTTKLVKVNPATPKQGIDIDDLGNKTIIVHVPGNASGNVTVKVGNNTYNATVINGTGVVNLVNETPGNHNVTVIYSGEDGKNTTITKFISIRKYETPIRIEVNDEYYVGDPINIVVRVPGNVTGNVTIEIDGVNHTAKPNEGVALFPVSGLKYGNKTVTAVYAGDDSYAFNSTTAQFKVLKRNAPMSVSVATSEGKATITVSDLPGDATGYVVLNVNGTEYGINITQSDEITIPILKSGTYNLHATYLGDDKYLTNSYERSFKANKESGDVEIEVENATTGQPVIVKVTVPDDGKGNVTIIVDNITKVVNVTGGENVIEVPGVSKGTHDVNVTYKGEDDSSKTLLTKVSVFDSIVADNLKRGWDSPYDYQAEFLGKDGCTLKNTNVQFIVNGKTYTVKTDREGIAYLTDSHLPVGVYDITSVNPVTGEKVTKKVTIVKRILLNKDITMDFLDGTYHVVRVIGDDGNPVGTGEFVDIYAHTIHYSCRTDKDGYARLKINLNPKTYTLIAEYKNTKVTNKLVVKQTLKLVKKTVSVKKGKNLVLKAKLKWSNGKAIKGKVIKFKFKGKFYKAKTDSKGIAKVTIKSKVTKKLKKGKSYKYSVAYKTNRINGKVKVK